MTLLTREYVEALGFDIAKKKYYNASRVDAELESLKAGILELLEENANLRAELQERQATIDFLHKTEQELLAAEKKVRDSEELRVRAQELLKNADIEAGEVAVRASEMLTNAEEGARHITERAEAEAARLIRAAELKAEAISPLKKNGRFGGAMSKEQIEAVEELDRALEALSNEQATQLMKMRSTLIKLATEL